MLVAGPRAMGLLVVDALAATMAEWLAMGPMEALRVAAAAEGPAAAEEVVAMVEVVDSWEGPGASVAAFWVAAAREAAETALEPPEEATAAVAAVAAVAMEAEATVMAGKGEAQLAGVMQEGYVVVAVDLVAVSGARVIMVGIREAEEEGRGHQLGDLAVGSAAGGEAGATAKEGALVGGSAVARVELPEATAAPEVMAAAPRSS